MPASLDEALNNLKNDHEFLLKGDVFTEDVIETWIEYKMANEVDAIRLRPHPYEVRAVCCDGSARKSATTVLTFAPISGECVLARRASDGGAQSRGAARL